MGVNRNDNENSRCRFFIASVDSMFYARFRDSRSRSLRDFSRSSEESYSVPLLMVGGGQEVLKTQGICHREWYRCSFGD